MGKTVFKQIRAAAVVFLVLCLFMAATGGKERFHRNVTIISREQAGMLLQEEVKGNVQVHSLATKACPRAGTVSHHLLVSPVINAWFRELKRHRKEIGTFIVISPCHRRLGRGVVSLSLQDWNSAGTVTRVDRNLAGSIMKDLDIGEDDLAFYGEHGIETMLPYIAHYYPRARIVPLLIDEQMRNGGLEAKLRDSLFRVMKSNPDVFLLVSTDFSHGRGREVTERNDERSLRSIITLGRDPVRPVSDNTAGLAVLYHVCAGIGVEHTHLFCHTDAERFTGEVQGENITSYIFTFQY